MKCYDLKNEKKEYSKYIKMINATYYSNVDGY